jgi:hypothetical protein
MDEQRIQEVFSDEEFVQKLFSLETPEEAQAALKEKGVEVSVEELNQLRDFVIANVNENGELALDALDDVAGGFGFLGNLVGVMTILIPRPPVQPSPIPRPPGLPGLPTIIGRW